MPARKGQAFQEEHKSFPSRSSLEKGLKRLKFQLIKLEFERSNVLHRIQEYCATV